MYTTGIFTKYVDEIKNRVDSGEISKEEAVYFVIAKVANIFENITKGIDEEQFMKDRILEANNIN